jgi:threonylcarbamoyladenosine tRNA methylthiotransferase MtaB
MYDVEQFRKTVTKFRSVYPEFNFTTDIIVGFPGETEEEFQETLDAVSEFNFSHVHTFKYSVRKGTRAERLENHVPEKIKNERSLKVRELSEANKTAYLSSFVGKSEQVLIEKITQGIANGYGQHYIPVRFKANKAGKNTVCSVKMTELRGSGENIYLFGELKD